MAKAGAVRRSAGVVKRLTVKDLGGRIAALAQNLHWTWHPPTQRLFAGLDPAVWEATGHNPLQTLARAEPAFVEALGANSDYVSLLEQCEKDLAAYVGGRPWFGRAHKSAGRMHVAYFTMECAIHECLPTYSGGLGVLAGDHIKSASDLGVPFTTVSLLYRNGYFTQRLAPDGSSMSLYPNWDFEHMPVTDSRKSIRLPIGKRVVTAKIWLAQVGRCRMVLLDTDVGVNKPADRVLTSRLYGGDQTLRIAQEVLLGVGGLMALEKLGIKPTVLHLNEGHAAFAVLARAAQLAGAKKDFAGALRKVRRQTVFTTHTPVAAGHDRFAPKLLLAYMGSYASKLGLSSEQFLDLGREKPGDRKGAFCMTVLALNFAERVNGVSKLHGQVSREMWQEVYGAASADEVPIGSITNGIHSQTWLAEPAYPIYEKYLGFKPVGAGPKEDFWAKAGSIPDEELWGLRNTLRSRLVNFVRQRLVRQLLSRGASAGELAAAETVFDPHALTLGFSRRFATYKRATLIFRDVDRLAAILADAVQPVQIVFSGKAHPRDTPGQAFVQQVYKFCRDPRLAGRVVLIENYDMHCGRMLTSGSDVWLNNPLRPMEASGTSGMKPPLHGGINCSILDGWWPEACNGENGWAVGSDGTQTFADQEEQDAFDANSLYTILEEQVIPEFYDRDEGGIPRRWLKRAKASMATVCGPFSTTRMVSDYVEQYYIPAHRGVAAKG